MKIKALITGISGFVGPYLKEQLSSHGIEVFGMDKNGCAADDHMFYGDITDAKFINEVIEKVKPDFIYHLAGFSSVHKSFENSKLVFDVNVGGTRNILEAMREFTPGAKILIAASAVVYGTPLKVPILESEPTKESSPYGNSRIETERILIEEFGDINWILSRSFNHTGPGQPTEFVIPDFCHQAVLIEKGLQDPIIITGNLEVIRDFSDVRDVVLAYQLLLEKGKMQQIYNVGSGEGYKILDLVKYIISCVNVSIKIQQKQDRVRQVDNPLLVADVTKLIEDTGWSRTYSIEETIRDIIQYFKNTL